MRPPRVLSSCSHRCVQLSCRAPTDEQSPLATPNDHVSGLSPRVAFRNLVPTATGLALVILGVVLNASVALGQPPPDPTDPDDDGVPGVTDPPAGAPSGPEVYAIQGTARVLVDYTHDESFSVRGFTDYLESQGWLVTRNFTSPITEEFLGSYDVFVVPTRIGQSITPFTPQEQAAVNSFLGNGGGLWLFHESSRSAAGINSLSTAYGVSFQFDLVIDSTDNEGQVFWPTIHLLDSHPITDGVTSFGDYGGCCLNVSAPAEIIGQGDDDTFSSECVSFPPTLAVYESGLGRIVFSGDITPLNPSYYPEALRAEEELLLQNIANWLAGKTTTSTDNTSWGQIKALYE